MGFHTNLYVDFRDEESIDWEALGVGDIFIWKKDAEQRKILGMKVEDTYNCHEILDLTDDIGQIFGWDDKYKIIRVIDNMSLKEN